MQNNFLKHPVLTVSIAGQDIDKQPSSFSLITDQDLPSVMARLAYPHDTVVGAVSDPVTVFLLIDGEPVRYFTGTVYKIYEEGKLQVLELTDGYKKLCDTMVTPAYRKETAKAILQDALDAAGITETKVSCPAVTVGRFSTVSISAARCITLLIKVLEEHGVLGLRYFFDEQDVFHFGTGVDTGKNEGEAVAFESGKDILSKEDGYIEVLPYPIRHSQSITIDEVTMATVRTDLIVSRQRSRLTLWTRKA
jgi:hypothetical protein